MHWKYKYFSHRPFNILDINLYMIYYYSSKKVLLSIHINTPFRHDHFWFSCIRNKNELTIINRRNQFVSLHTFNHFIPFQNLFNFFFSILILSLFLCSQVHFHLKKKLIESFYKEIDWKKKIFIYFYCLT